MDGHCTLGLVHNVNETDDNVVAGGRPVNEKEVVMVKIGISKALCIVDFLIQANDCCDIFSSKIVEINFRSMVRIA